MAMDGNGSDHSRNVSSENTNGSWSWDNEDVSISRLHLGPPSDELQDIVEDKEIAACAVAFVVNSTRKGIVPLCADVASLMRAKRRLEKRVMRLKREVEVLRNVSHHGSHSSTPTSAQSYNGSFMDPAHVQVFNELLKGTYCGSGSTVSSCSSQVGSSPKSERRPRSALHRTTAARNQLELERVVVHQLPSATNSCSAAPTVTTASSLMAGQAAAAASTGSSNPGPMASSSSGSESVGFLRTEPCPVLSGGSVAIEFSDLVDEQEHREGQRLHNPVDGASSASVNGLNSNSAAVDAPVSHNSASQCCCKSDSMLALEDQFNKSLEMNMKLAGELATTRRQMELLTTKLKQFELRELSREIHYVSLPASHNDVMYPVDNVVELSADNTQEMSSLQKEMSSVKRDGSVVSNARSSTSSVTSGCSSGVSCHSTDVTRPPTSVPTASHRSLQHLTDNKTDVDEGFV